MAATVGAQLNVLDPVLYAGDPYPAYQWLRDAAPVYWDPVNEIWAVSRHRDVLAIERDPARYSSARGSRPLIEMTASMINRDDPRHQQQRKLVSRRFSPRAVRRHEDRIRALARGLVATAAEKETVDVVEDLAAPLPAMVIGELLGFDPALWPKCREWSELTMSWPVSATTTRASRPGRRRPSRSSSRPSASWRRPAGPTRGTTWCPPGYTAPSTASRWTCRS